MSQTQINKFKKNVKKWTTVGMGDREVSPLYGRRVQKRVLITYLRANNLYLVY